VPPQLARGFSTICVVPSQLINDASQLGSFCAELVGKVARLLRSGGFGCRAPLGLGWSGLPRRFRCSGRGRPCAPGRLATGDLQFRGSRLRVTGRGTRGAGGLPALPFPGLRLPAGLTTSMAPGCCWSVKAEQQRWLRDAVATASGGQRCRSGTRRYDIGGPSTLLPWRIVRFARCGRQPAPWQVLTLGIDPEYVDTQSFVSVRSLGAAAVRATLGQRLLARSRYGRLPLDRARKEAAIRVRDRARANSSTAPGHLVNAEGPDATAFRAFRLGYWGGRRDLNP
jgi:hypothetical protein